VETAGLVVRGLLVRPARHQMSFDLVLVTLRHALVIGLASGM